MKKGYVAIGAIFKENRCSSLLLFAFSLCSIPHLAVDKWNFWRVSVHELVASEQWGLGLVQLKSSMSRRGTVIIRDVYLVENHSRPTPLLACVIYF